MPSASGRPCRVCLVTSEFHGLFKNGGIGTANTGLALTLAEAGCEVTVAYVDQVLVDLDERRAASADTVKSWAGRGVALEFVPLHPGLRAGHEDHVAASFAVLEFLKGRTFDVVYFNECGGQGYYALLARRAGLFPATRMIVVTHGANAWVLELNAQLYWGLHPISVDYLERRSVELADDLVSPSHYLVRWMQARGWRLPASTRVIQNALPATPPPPRPVSAIAEIVFFGRLEARKGVDLFLSAIARLAQTRDLSQMRITFLGKFSRIEGIHSGVYVLERTRAWPQPPTLLTELGQEEALAYLCRPGVLAVIPSRAENSPCVVAECLIAGVPFVATDSGGTAELIAPGYRGRTLAAPEPEALARRIGEALEKGARPAALAVAQDESRRLWRELTLEPPPPTPLPRAAPVAAAVSLCLALRAPLRAEVWSMLRAQDFAEIVVVVPDESVALPNDARIRRHVEPELDAAGALNRAAREAQGPWLMFADAEDVVLRADALGAFIAAARGLEAEVVTSPSLEWSHAGAPREGFDRFVGHLPVGANLALAPFENCIGEGCFLIDRARFLDVGGFAPDVSEALRDRLLLTQAALAGARLEVAPQALFWRRRASAETFALVESSADRRRMIAAFAGQPAGTLAPALESLAAMSRTREQMEATIQGLGSVARELAVRLSRLPQRDGSEQNRPFLEYALMRGRVREALAFAEGLGDGELLALARDGAAAVAAKAALGVVREPAEAETRTAPLLKIAAERAQPLTGLGPDDLQRDESLRHPARGLTVVKAARLCPPAARRLVARVSAGAGVRVALAACDRFALLRLEGEHLRGEDLFGWTGWRTPGDLALDLPAFAGAADILLFSEGRAAEPVVWSALGADLPLVDFSTPSGVAVESGATALPQRLLAAAELLTPAPDFPGPYFVAGSPSTHHPLVGRPALVRVPHAAFQGARGFRASFGLEHEKSRPVGFALWARPKGASLRDAGALGQAAPFSGWTVVRAAFQQHRAEIVFPEPLTVPHDLYLATKVVDHPDNNYCHAVWHDIVVLEG